MNASQPNWALLYKLNGSVPAHFCDIHWVDSVVWIQTGGVLTHGTGQQIQCTDVGEAARRFDLECKRAEDAGFALVRRGTYDPARFDYEGFKHEVREGSRRAFTAVRQAHPDLQFVGYSLGSDPSVMTIGCAMQDLAEVTRAGSEDNFFNYHEWSTFEGSEYLDIAYRLLLPQFQKIPWVVGFIDHRIGIHGAIVGALQELVNEGFFGDDRARDGTFVIVSDIDDYHVDAAKQLNTPAMYRRFQTWWKVFNG